MSDKRYLGNIITPTPTAPAGPYEDSAAKGVWSLQEAYTYIKAGAWPTAGNQLPLIEDVFSTYLYTGTGAAQTITNGIDLAGEGGLVWIKSRSAATNHFLFDTVRGTTDELNSNTTDAEASLANSVTAFNADGFDIGSATGIGVSAATYASWTFRKAPRFFDVVTYTGDGVAGRTVSHNLGTTVGTLIVKKTSGTDNWFVWHRNLTDATYRLLLNNTAAETQQTNAWNSTAPTSTEFTLGDNANVNENGATYVAYLFAHDPLGPSGDGSDGLIACGTCSGETGGNRDINLGWEPQWVLTKVTDTTGNWRIVDNMRAFLASGTGVGLAANTANAEAADDTIHVRSTGFYVNGLPGSGTYVYIAIRRGPMREPTSGTEVFDVETSTSSPDAVFTTGFPVDMIWNPKISGSPDNFPFIDRMRGTTASIGRWLVSSSNGAEQLGSGFGWVIDNNTTWTSSNVWGANAQVGYGFRRAPGFFDVVAYTGGNLVSGVLNHNLGVKPELVIIKQRNTINSINREWAVGAPDILGINNNTLSLNNNYANGTLNYNMFDTTGGQTSTQIKLHGNEGGISSSTGTYIAYLFATLPGVSKVGSYTGNGSSQTIDCGFTSGARFVLIKRTDSTGDWYVWDSARGIVAGNDPHLSLNTTAAEVTTDDSVDAESSGFIVNQDAATNVNVATASYIFLAVA
jgi:hypothetical protein